MSVRDDIATAGASLAAAINAGDAAKAAAHYTADGAVLPPGAPTMSGTAGVQGYWQAAIDMGLKDVVLTTQHVTEQGDHATEIGTLTGTLGDASLAGKYIVLWKNEGGWKLHQDIWNFDA